MRGTKLPDGRIARRVAAVPVSVERPADPLIVVKSGRTFAKLHLGAAGQKLDVRETAGPKLWQRSAHLASIGHCVTMPVPNWANESQSNKPSCHGSDVRALPTAKVSVAQSELDVAVSANFSIMRTLSLICSFFPLAVGESDDPPVRERQPFSRRSSLTSGLRPQARKYRQDMVTVFGSARCSRT
jgi:hypothetical protein